MIVEKSNSQTRKPQLRRLPTGLSGLLPVLALSFFAASANAETTLAPIRFTDACAGTSHVTIGAVGDFLMHDPLQKKAARQKTFANQWRMFHRYTHGADIMYGNLEAPTARGITRDQREIADPGFVWDNEVYTSYQWFNVHPKLVEDIKATGFDVVSTANNHALDRGAIGVTKTIDELERSGLPFTGTRRSGEKRDWHAVVEKNGFKTAWLACTFILNSDFLKKGDREGQVLSCNSKQVLSLIKRLAGEHDAVIVTPHWGHENHDAPAAYQIKAAKMFLDAGAAMILGAHPHTLQPMEKHITPDGRETFVIYSLANFISFQPAMKNKATVMLFVGLSKDRTGQTFINGVRFVPAFMRNRTGNLMDVEVLPIEEGRAYGQEGLEHILKILPKENMMRYGDAIVTNPECQR